VKKRVTHSGTGKKAADMQVRRNRPASDAARKGWKRAKKTALSFVMVGVAVHRGMEKSSNVQFTGQSNGWAGSE
jgi:hypothetical protein